MFNDPAQSARNTFATLVVERYKARNWPNAISYNEANFSLDLGTGAGHVYLENIFSDWQKAESASEKDGNIERLINSSFHAIDPKEDNKTFEQTLPDILPAIRARDYVENLWMSVGDTKLIESMAAISRPFAESLSIVLMVNTPDAIGTVRSDKLKEWGKTFDDIYPLALANLKRFKSTKFDTVKRGLYLLSSDDFFDPSALLMPEVFQKLDVKGDVIAVAVSRGLVEVTGSTDLANQPLFGRIVEGEYSKDSRPISLSPLMLKNGRWQVYDGPSGKYPTLDRLKALERMTSAQNQKATMEAYFSKTGRDVFVATFDLIEDNGNLTSFSTLTAGVNTLLPQTEIVILAPPDMGTPLARRWEDVMTVCGPLPIEPHTYPPRYVFADGARKEWTDRLSIEFKHPGGFPELKPQTKS